MTADLSKFVSDDSLESFAMSLVSKSVHQPFPHRPPAVAGWQADQFGLHTPFSYCSKCSTRCGLDGIAFT
ncbi:MAG: hypothetical protein M3512_18550 [Bacteroidota bacterium]|nr:hypothetical protein [Bacteroidota bacterium]